MQLSKALLASLPVMEDGLSAKFMFLPGGRGSRFFD